MTMFESTSLKDGFGVEVTGLDLSGDIHADGIAALRLLFHDSQLMVIRSQDITPQRFLWFARHFGAPQPHILAHLRHRDVPEILPLSNIFENDKPIGVFDGAAFWHQDMAFEEVASNVTIVHALEVPDIGGETLFADMWAAHDALDVATRDRIRDLVARHRYGNRADEHYQSRGKAMELTEDEQKEVRDVYHPLVLYHPVTGRPGLYGVASTSRGIRGMADAEAQALLDRLTEHAAEARFVYAHSYRVGDIILWDNFSLMHKATLIDHASGPGTRRYLRRISTKAIPVTA
ncbi:MAG TPA: TauD/TfdA family dioxygenase [Thermohalobaculum sp.]|nr:TauD/TfdA family dioxygenase [Thermohalobaculum sp.]